MTTPHKSTREPHEKAEFLDTLIPVYEKNVERLAELEKKSLEVVAEQNADLDRSLQEEPSTLSRIRLGFFCSICSARHLIVLWRPRKASLILRSSRAIPSPAWPKSAAASAAKMRGGRDRPIPADGRALCCSAKKSAGLSRRAA